jgi:hypothetical protein
LVEVARTLNWAVAPRLTVVFAGCVLISGWATAQWQDASSTTLAMSFWKFHHEVSFLGLAVFIESNQKRVERPHECRHGHFRRRRKNWAGWAGSHGPGKRDARSSWQEIPGAA